MKATAKTQAIHLLLFKKSMVVILRSVRKFIMGNCLCIESILARAKMCSTPQSKSKEPASMSEVQCRFTHLAVAKNFIQMCNTSHFRSFSYFFKNALNKSIGSGRNVVVLCSLAISRMVWR